MSDPITPGLDLNLMFQPLLFVVLTISDTRTKADDRSGKALVSRMEMAGHSYGAHNIVKDDVEAIRGEMTRYVNSRKVKVVITTGGTGLTGRDVTIEAIKPLFDKRMDGFSTIFHQLSYKQIGVSTIQSRACAGIIGETFVFCLPGSTKAVELAWDEIISPLLDSRHRPTSLVDLIPRLKE